MSKLLKIGILIIFLIVSIGFVYGENNTINNFTISNTSTIKAIEGGDSNISFEEGYKGYCAEWGEHSAEQGQEFYIKNTSEMNNSNYLKTMFLFFYDQTQKDVYGTQHMVWKFTDNKQFSRFNQTWYNQIIETGDKYTISDTGKIPINETHQFSFDFKLFMPLINEFQNFFAYQFLIEEITDEPNIEINNSTINNSTVIIPECQNNNSFIQNNETIILDSNFNNVLSISSNPYLDVTNVTGINLWALGCMIIMLIIIWVFDKKSK